MQEQPAQLLERPTPFAAVVGDGALADTAVTHLSALHSGDGAHQPFRFEAYGTSHEWPKKSNKRADRPAGREFDGYLPKGILKSNWLNKHHRNVPCLFVAALDFEIKTPPGDWAAAEVTVVDTVSRLREAAAGRNSEVHILFVQDRLYPRADEEKAAVEASNERILSLRKKLPGMDSKSVTVLHAADLQNGTPAFKKFDAMLCDKGIAYYRYHARRIKKLKNRVHTATQAALHVRHHFKIAHFYEFCGLNEKALNFYTTAYKYLADMPKSNDNIDEAKAVADWINFRICFLNLAKIEPGAAAQQFRWHMSCYLRRVGDTSLAFRHWAWVAKQNLVFAELLNKFVGRVNSKTDPYQTATHYFHSAALHAIQRRKAAQSMEAYVAVPGVENKPEAGGSTGGADSGIMILEPHYVGGEPRVVILGADGAGDRGAEIAALRKHYVEHERSFNHAQQIVALLDLAQRFAVRDGGAVALDAKTVESPVCWGSRMTLGYALPPKPSRIRIWRQTLLAEELWNCGEYATVHALLAPVASFYRNEQWWGPLTQVLERLLLCAHRLGDVRHFIDYSLQLMVPFMTNSPNDRTVVQRKFLFALTAPSRLGTQFSSSSLSAEEVASAVGEASAAIASVSTRLDVPDGTVLEFPLEASQTALLCAQVGFTSRTVMFGETAGVIVQLSSNFPLPIHFSRVDVEFDDPRYNTTLKDATPRTMRRRSSLRAVDAQTVRAAMATPRRQSRAESGSGPRPVEEGNEEGNDEVDAVEDAVGISKQVSLLKEDSNVGLDLATPKREESGDAVGHSSESRVVDADLCLLPETQTDVEFSVRIIAPDIEKRADCPNQGQGATASAITDVEQHLRCVRVVAYLDLGHETSGGGGGDGGGAGGGTGKGTVLVFNVPASPIVAEPPDIGDIVREVAATPFHRAYGPSKGGSAAPTTPPHGTAAPAPLLSRASSATAFGDGPFNELRAALPPCRFELRMSLLHDAPTFAATDAVGRSLRDAVARPRNFSPGPRSRSVSRLFDISLDAGTAPTVEQLAFAAATSAPSGRPMLPGGFHALILEVHSNEEAIAGGVAYIEQTRTKPEAGVDVWIPTSEGHGDGPLIVIRASEQDANMVKHQLKLGHGAARHAPTSDPADEDVAFGFTSATAITDSVEVQQMKQMGEIDLPALAAHSTHKILLFVKSDDLGVLQLAMHVRLAVPTIAWGASSTAGGPAGTPARRASVADAANWKADVSNAPERLRAASLVCDLSIEQPLKLQSQVVREKPCALTVGFPGTDFGINPYNPPANTALVVVGQPFAISAHIVSKSLHPIVVHKIEAMVKKGVDGRMLSTEDELNSMVPEEGLLLSAGEQLTIAPRFIVGSPVAPCVPSEVIVHWSSPSAAFADRTVTSMFDLCRLRAHVPLVSLDVDAPATGTVGKAAPLSVRLENKGKKVLRFVVSVGGSSTEDMVLPSARYSVTSSTEPLEQGGRLAGDEAFFVAGARYHQLELLPASTTTIEFALIPTTPGFCSLPNLTVSPLTVSDKVNPPVLLPDDLPTIFVFPESDQ